MKRVMLVVALVVVLGAAVGVARWWAAGRHPAAGPAATAKLALNTVTMDPSSFAGLPYEPPKIVAEVQPYQVAADLSNVSNRKLLPKLTAEQRQALVRNAFVGRPTDEQQLFFIYESNAYQDIPSFITTDSVLQAYHIFYDFSLRSVETAHLDKELRRMTTVMLAASRKMLEEHPSGLLHDACLKNVAYFAVASRLLGEKTEVPDAAEAMVTAELKAVKAHAARSQSAIFPYDIEYTQFNPRGHYTRSETLRRFFKAMMWYGLVPLPLELDKNVPNREQTLQALLMARVLEDSGAWKSWDAIYYPTAFYVGTADDLTPAEYRKLAIEVFGENASPEKLADTGRLDDFIGRAKKLRPPGIATYMIGVPNGAQFRFMGQRFIADSRILQEMTHPKVTERFFPRGLDVCAALGSERAIQHLDTLYQETRYGGYLDQRKKMQQEMSATSPETWRSNLYWGWLFTLRPFMERRGDGYPSFMMTDAWQDKQLVASLGSWAELRHDTILYGKQSASECGGEEPPPPPKGYVEPEPEVYARLAWLTALTADGLKSRGLLDDALASRFSDFKDLLTFLRDCSLKELRNEELTREEYEQLKTYGGTLEYLTLSMVQAPGEIGPTAWSELTSAADKDMAVVADVHTSVDQCLEEGVGRAVELWVVVPIGGKLWLTRGASFSYYEFQHPTADRLTDEKWQEILKADAAKPMPSWTESYLVGPKKKGTIPTEQLGTGC